MIRNFLCIIASIPVIAQVNIEANRDGNSHILNKTILGLNSSINSGYSNYYSIGFNAQKNIVEFEHIDGFAIIQVKYAKSGETTYINHRFIHLRFLEKREPEKPIPEMFVQFETNDHGIIKFRHVIGTSMRYTALSAQMGTGILHEWFKESNETSTQKIVRISHYISLSFMLNAFTKLVSTTYIQPRIGDISNMRVFLESTIKNKLSPTTAIITTLKAKGYSKSTIFNGIDINIRSGIEVVI